MPDPATTRDPEIVDDGLEDAAPASALTPRSIRHPAVPVNLHELSARGGEAIEIIQSRVAILETARKQAIRMTSPEDWVLFKSPDDRVTGYLQDAGCERARDILGIEVFNVQAPERIPSADGQSFMYVIQGDGRSRLTMQHVESMEGGRTSTEDFCKGKTGAELELLVRKAARANLDGNVARELMGLKSVPLPELVAAWEGTSKNAEHCRKGKGFGSAEERLGATRQGVPDVPPPTCTVCKGADGQPLPLVYRTGKDGRPSFYGCKNYSAHPNQKVTVDADAWIRTQQKAQRERDQDARAQAAEIEDAKRQDAEIARAEGVKNGH